MKRIIKLIRNMFAPPRAPDGCYHDKYHALKMKVARQMRAEYEATHPNHKWKKELP